jgi:hypothetical protein
MIKFIMLSIAGVFFASASLADVATEFDDTDFNVVEKTHLPLKLRYGFAYYFNQSFNGGDNKSFLRKFHVMFTEGGDYDYLGKGMRLANPTFRWTNKIEKDKFYVDDNVTVNIIQSNPDRYSINYMPEKRLNNNLSVTYTLWIYENVSDEWSKKTKLIDVQPYEITWCGDGIVDNYLDAYNGNKIAEICDPQDPNKLGWRNNVCSSKCGIE